MILYIAFYGFGAQNIVGLIVTVVFMVCWGWWICSEHSTDDESRETRSSSMKKKKEEKQKKEVWPWTVHY